MKATLYLSDPRTGQILAARLVEVEFGKIVGAGFLPAKGPNGELSYEAAVRATGLSYVVVLDMGFGVSRWRSESRGFGWGGSRAPFLV